MFDDGWVRGGLEQLRTDAVRYAAQPVITLLEGDRALAVLAVADAIREESFEAVRRLHQQGIEVIMMTGDDSQETRASAAECGADHFLPKPFSAAEVRELVVSAAGRKSVL